MKIEHCFVPNGDFSTRHVPRFGPVMGLAFNDYQRLFRTQIKTTLTLNLTCATSIRASFADSDLPLEESMHVPFPRNRALHERWISNQFVEIVSLLFAECKALGAHSRLWDVKARRASLDRTAEGGCLRIILRSGLNRISAPKAILSNLRRKAARR